MCEMPLPLNVAPNSYRLGRTFSPRGQSHLWVAESPRFFFRGLAVRNESQLYIKREGTTTVVFYETTDVIKMPGLHGTTS